MTGSTSASSAWADAAPTTRQNFSKYRRGQRRVPDRRGGRLLPEAHQSRQGSAQNRRRLSGLSRDPQPQRHRRGGYRHAGSLARQASRSRRWITAKTCISKSRCAIRIEETRQLVGTVKETGRVLQVGSQTTSADQWWKAKKAIADGMIGKMIMSQGSYHRNSSEGEWNWTNRRRRRAGRPGRELYRLENVAGSGAQASLRRRPLLPLPQILGLFGRHRDRPVLSRGRAAEHLLGQAQFPSRVVAGGGIYVFKDEREVPDTFHLMADYAGGSFAGAQLVHGELAAHPGADPRARRHPHHGGERASSRA